MLKNVVIAPDAEIDEGVRIGAHTRIEKGVRIYAGVEIGPFSYVGPHCVLGERLRGYYHSKRHYRPPACRIGPHSILRAGTVIYGGVVTGPHFETGPYVTIREKTKIGRHVRLGNFSDIQGCSTLGNYVSAHSSVTVGQFSAVSDYVWLMPFVILLNDLYPPTALDMRGPRIGAYSVLGAHTTVFPGVKLGKHVVAAAHSLIKNNIPAYQAVSGNPAKVIVDSRKIIAPVRGKMIRPYPWTRHRPPGAFLKN